jgi:hypothetical protein
VGSAAGHATLVVALNRLGLKSGLVDLKFSLAIFAVGGLGVLGPTLLAPTLGLRPQLVALLANAPALGLITLVVGRRVLRTYRSGRPKDLETADLPRPTSAPPDGG